LKISNFAYSVRILIWGPATVILDCTETAVEQSKCLNCRIRIYSHYKGNYTVKTMLGIAPDD